MVGWLFRNMSAMRVGVAKPASVCGWVNRLGGRLAVQKHECHEGRGGKTSQCLWVGEQVGW